jgi:hypothetical protein
MTTGRFSLLWEKDQGGLLPLGRKGPRLKTPRCLSLSLIPSIAKAKTWPWRPSGPGALFPRPSRLQATDISVSVTTHSSRHGIGPVGHDGTYLPLTGKSVPTTLERRSGARLPATGSAAVLSLPRTSLYGRPHRSVSREVRSYSHDLALAFLMT